MSHHNSPSPDITDETSECGLKPTLSIMKLPNEIHHEIFSHVDILRDAVSLRVTCRHFNEVYEARKQTILLNVREALVRPIREYYEFLESMTLPPGSIFYPPASGWANITEEACKGYDKVPLAIDVLKHFPFLSEGSIIEEIAFKYQQ